MDAHGEDGTFALGDRQVRRLGFGAMRLAGPNAFGPPASRETAVSVLQEAISSGINHIDTSDYYGPHIVNQLIREALHPYPGDLVIVTKVGATRSADASWIPALAPEDLINGVHDNLRNLRMDRLDIVNLRVGGVHGPVEGSIARQFETLVRLKDDGLIAHLGLSNVTASQVDEARAIAPIACVQNHYNLVHLKDEPLIAALAAKGIAYVPFFPLGGFSPLNSDVLNDVARSLDARPMQVALAWLLNRFPNIILIPGTSSIAHLRENIAATSIVLPQAAIDRLDHLANRSDKENH